MECFSTLLSLLEQGEKSMLVTVIQTKGSSPRESGTRMVVSRGEIAFGTIGGGHLEYQACHAAVERLSSQDEVWCQKVLSYALGASLGQCCGGVVDVLFEVIDVEELFWLKALLEQLLSVPFHLAYPYLYPSIIK